MNQTINTNGLFIDGEWAKRLVQANLILTYSIDGVTKDTFEYIRKGAKFEDLLKSICIINKYKEKYRQGISSYKFETAINVVIMKSNYRQLEQFVDFAKECHFDELQLTPIQYVDGIENIFLHQDQEAEEYIEDVMPEILRKSKDYGVKVFNLLPRIRSEKDERNNQEIYCASSENKELLCFWPWQYLIVDVNGKVRPFCFCNREVGDIFKNSLEDNWNNEIMQLYRRKIFTNNFENWCDSRCFSGVMQKEHLGFDR